MRFVLFPQLHDCKRSLGGGFHSEIKVREPSLLRGESPPLVVAEQDPPPAEPISQYAALLKQVINGSLLLFRKPAGHHRCKYG